MTPTRRTTLALAASLVLLSVSLAQAQVPIRVRGAITKVEGQTLTIASRDNSTVDIKMADNFTVIGVVKATMSDIKAGTFVGIAGLAQPDGSFRAQEVLVPGAHVFISAQQQADGTVTASRALVGKDGLVPPM
jgi:hypothetical protein